MQLLIISLRVIIDSSINSFCLYMVDFEIKLNLPNVAPFSQLYELARARCSVKPFERHSVKIDFSWAQPFKIKEFNAC